MSTRRAAAIFLTAIALTASFAVVVAGGTGGGTGTGHQGRATSASLQIQTAIATGRIEVLRPRGYSGDDQPVGQRVRTIIGALIGQALPQNGIQYHGGPVVMGAKVVSIYWAGSTIFPGGPTPGTTGTGPQDGSLIGHFLRNLGGSPYYNINTTYTDSNGNPIPNSVAYSGYWANNTSIPSDCTPVVSDSQIQSMIVSGFANGKYTYDPNTVYAVFTAGKVNLGGNFGNCTPGAAFQYCAYHGYFSSSYGTVLYAAMPYNAAYTGSGCTAFAAGGPPNGDPGADAEVNTLAHEIEEANTDPRLNAWWTTSDGSENADKCAWTFGTVNLTGDANVANTANITVGSKNFLVQRNWLNLNGGSCAQTYAGSSPTVPGAPTLNSATAGNAQVALSWSAPSNNGGSSITGYKVYRSTTSGGEGTTAYATLGNVTSYTDTGVTNGTTYYYKVAATNSIGTGAQSGEKSAKPSAPTVPGAPTLNSATPGNQQVALAWSAPGSNGGSAIDGYYVYRNGTKLPTLIAGTSTTITGLTNGQSYSFTVTAHNSVGEGAQSNSRSATPSAPTVPGAPTLNSATPGNQQVALAWSAPGSNGGSAIDGYYVYRNGTKLPTLIAGTSTTITGLTNGQSYSFTVTAHNTLGESAQSNARSATPAASGSVPGAPTLTASRAGFFQRGIRLNWTVAPNGGSVLTGYRIYRSTSSGTEVLLTTRNASSTSYTDSSTTSGVTYFYRVSATNANGEGALSNEASAQAR